MKKSEINEIEGYGESCGEVELLGGIRPDQGIQETWDEHRPSDWGENGAEFCEQFSAWKEGYLKGNPR